MNSLYTSYAIGIYSLPPDVLRLIFALSGTCGRFSLRMTCRRFRQLIGSDAPHKLLLREAAHEGYLGFLMWVFDTFNMQTVDLQPPILFSASGGQLDTLQWFLEDHCMKPGVPVSEHLIKVLRKVCQAACMKGQVGVLQWLYTDWPCQYVRSGIVHLMLMAIEYEQPAVLCWIKRTDSSVISKDIWRYAAKVGAVKVFHWAADNAVPITEGVLTTVLDNSSLRIRLDVVQWLCEHGHTIVDQDLVMASRYTNIQVFQYLYSKYSENVHGSTPLTTLLNQCFRSSLVFGGDLDVARWLLGNTDNEIKLDHTLYSLLSDTPERIDRLDWLFSIGCPLPAVITKRRLDDYRRWFVAKGVHVK